MTNGNDLASPTLLYNSATGEANGHELGLTKREYFAAMAVQGLLAHGVKHINIAQMAVSEADNLINELNKTQTNEQI